jgi:hypothetical protein
VTTKKELTTPPLTEVQRNHPVTVAGERGPYKFVKINESDNSVTVYGGDKDPGGKNSMRTFVMERVTPLPVPKTSDEDL